MTSGRRAATTLLPLVMTTERPNDTVTRNRRLTLIILKRIVATVTTARQKPFTTEKRCM